MILYALEAEVPASKIGYLHRVAHRFRYNSSSLNGRRAFSMPFSRKSRFVAVLIVLGCLLAAAGEVVNASNMDVLSSSWRFSLGLIVVGTFILLLGLSPLASMEDQVGEYGFAGCHLLVLGGLLLIIGTVALDWIILPFLLSLANTIAATINGPATSTQDALNKVISSINSLGGSILQKLLPGATPHIPSAHIPRASGIDLVNKALIELHFPTIDRLTWWGHFSLSGGPLAVGCLILGLALPRKYTSPIPALLLIVFALLNVLSQFVTVIPPYIGNITAIVLFLTLAWLGVSVWLATRPVQMRRIRL
jgi:hypothetical protein